MRVLVFAALLGSVIGLVSGCSSDKPKPPPPASRAAAPAAAAPGGGAATPAATTTEDGGAAPVLKGVEFTENDFVESDHSRDPFRNFVLTQAKAPTLNQREVKLSQYSIDELKLVAIVQGGDQARAMFIDPGGKGTVIYRGNFICRPELVHLGGAQGPEYQLNWRVDRIRDGDVVLIREDPAQPAIPPATRVVPLHPENEKEKRLN